MKHLYSTMDYLKKVCGSEKYVKWGPARKTSPRF